MMSDDYLWDRSGEADPEVQRLEELLGRLRSQRDKPESAPGDDRDERVVRFARSPWRFRPAAVLAAAAAVVLVVVGAWWLTRSPIELPAFDVTRLAGAPTIASRAIGDSGKLRVGQRLETDTGSRARIDIGDVGEVEVDPDTTIRLVASRAAEHRLALDRGVIHAFIWAPPRQFYVETPSAVAVDLGCAYTLEVDSQGVGILRVAMGWVGFETDGLESFIPEGAMCVTRPGLGPGVPFYEDASEKLRAAVARLDVGEPDPKTRAAVLTELLDETRSKDAFTLWHLLPRVRGEERGRVFDRMAELVPPPDGVTREGILRGDRRMLELWWDRLGLLEIDWWRQWKLPEPPA